LKINDKKLDEDFSFSDLKISKFQAFKNAWKKNILNLAMVNFIAVIGAVFALFFILSKTGQQTILGKELGFSNNIGAGGQLSVGMDRAYTLRVIELNFELFLMLIPGLVLFGVFLSGCFYVIKHWVYAKQIRIIRVFLKGAKQNALTFAVVGALFGVVLLLCNFLLAQITLARLDGAGGFGYLLAEILVWLFACLVFISCAFMLCYVTTYKTYNIAAVIVKGFRFTYLNIMTFLKNLLFSAVAFGPAALFLISGAATVVAILYLFIGISYATLAFFLYSQHVFESADGGGKSFSRFEINREGSKNSNEGQNNIVESTSSDVTLEQHDAGQHNAPVPVKSANKKSSNKKKHSSKKRKR